MIRTLSRNWWLLALCGVLHAVISVICLAHYMRDTGFNGWSTNVWSSVVFVGELALAAGACTMAAGIWRSAKGKCWPLVLNGLALGALGLILTGIFGSSISFRTVAFLIIVMATSIGIFELLTARTLRRQHHLADGWFLGLAGVLSVGFALAFFALGSRWINIEAGSHSDLLWIGSYFGFSAICLLVMALRLRSPGLSQSGQGEALPPLGNPRHAH